MHFTEEQLERSAQPITETISRPPQQSKEELVLSLSLKDNPLTTGEFLVLVSRLMEKLKFLHLQNSMMWIFKDKCLVESWTKIRGENGKIGSIQVYE